MSGLRQRVLVVVKRTAFDAFGKHDPVAKRLLRSKDAAVARMVPAHEAHHETVEVVRMALRARGIEPTVVRAASDVRRWFPSGRFELVVTVGGDGTLLAASHHVGTQTAILGINSAPRDSVGYFCGATKDDAAAVIDRALRGKLRAMSLSRMQVELGGEIVHRRVLNEALFCHASPAATSRYILELDRDGKEPRIEEHKSSGFWVGPAAGSTAAQQSAGGRVLSLSSSALQFVVREPYAPWGSLHLTGGLVPDRARLIVRSKMRDARLFLDGDHTMIRCGLGDVVVFSLSPEPLRVLGLLTAQARAAETRKRRN